MREECENLIKRLDLDCDPDKMYLYKLVEKVRDGDSEAMREYAKRRWGNVPQNVNAKNENKNYDMNDNAILKAISDIKNREKDIIIEDNSNNGVKSHAK